MYAQPKREKPAVSTIVIKCLCYLSGVYILLFFFFPSALFHFMSTGELMLEQQVEMSFKRFDYHRENKVLWGRA